MSNNSVDFLLLTELVGMRSALSGHSTQPTILVSYRCFGRTNRSHLHRSSSLDWTLKMGPISFPETSVSDYLSTLHTNAEERRSHLDRGGSLKSHEIIGNFHRDFVQLYW